MTFYIRAPFYFFVIQQSLLEMWGVLAEFLPVNHVIEVPLKFLNLVSKII